MGMSDRHQGWTEERTTLADMKQAVADFIDARSWQTAHSPKNLVMSIAIEAAELMEIFQWVSSADADRHGHNPEILEHVQDEVADVLIYCLSLSRALGFDLAAATEQKIKKNGLKYPAPGPRGQPVR